MQSVKTSQRDEKFFLILLTKNQNMGIILNVSKENTQDIVWHPNGVLRDQKGWKCRISSVCEDSDFTTGKRILRNFW